MGDAVVHVENWLFIFNWIVAVLYFQKFLQVLGAQFLLVTHYIDDINLDSLVDNTECIYCNHLAQLAILDLVMLRSC